MMNVYWSQVFTGLTAWNLKAANKSGAMFLDENEIVAVYATWDEIQTAAAEGLWPTTVTQHVWNPSDPS